MSDTTIAGSGTLRGLQEGLKEWVGLIAAIMFLIGYLVLNYLLFSQQGNLQEPAWSHAMVLYTSVESIALTAAGYLFGREVNRERAAHAEEQANQAHQVARDEVQKAASETAKGEMVAEAVKALPERQVVAEAVKTLPERQQPELEAERTQAKIDYIKQLVQSIYP